jgi:hypothetical protein
MKRQTLYIMYFGVGIFSSCKSQNVREINTRDFAKQLETEINEKAFYRTLFSDTVVFEMSEKNVQSFQDKIIKENWNKVEILFKNADYVINSYDIKSNKIQIKQRGFESYYVLKSHKYIYILGLNKEGKITHVQEVKIDLPPNAPPH